MNWYYVDAGQQAGPISEDELATLAGSGKLQADTLVWREGMASWLPYSQAKPGGSLNAPPVISGGPGVAIETPAVGVASMEYGGFWIRFAAKMLDGLIQDIILVPFVLLFSPRISLIGRGGPPTPPEIATLVAAGVAVGLGAFVVVICYNTFFLGKFGATPGKMVCGLKVITAEGAPISYARALGRVAAEFLSRMFCDVGYIIAAFDSQKRSLHDHIANTRVIKTR
jgi:uncharacterized RDD family membrane protein YckC